MVISTITKASSFYVFSVNLNFDRPLKICCSNVMKLICVSKNDVINLVMPKVFASWALAQGRSCYQVSSNYRTKIKYVNYFSHAPYESLLLDFEI